jgi:hypothetical protein
MSHVAISFAGHYSHVSRLVTEHLRGGQGFCFCAIGDIDGEDAFERDSLLIADDIFGTSVCFSETGGSGSSMIGTGIGE